MTKYNKSIIVNTLSVESTDTYTSVSFEITINEYTFDISLEYYYSNEKWVLFVRNPTNNQWIMSRSFPTNIPLSGMKNKIIINWILDNIESLYFLSGNTNKIIDRQR